MNHTMDLEFHSVNIEKDALNLFFALAENIFTNKGLRQ
jgi:hypothetical protein